jgi:hypothetical protein
MIPKEHIRKLDMKISLLGAGVMRFQEDRDLFSPEAFELMDIAMSIGINYFDTAFLYCNSRSEEFVRRSLVEKYPRNDFVITDKLPVWLCEECSDMERIFDIQMERLGVEFIDIYLLHALNKETWTNVYNHGVLDFLEEKKKEGKIRKTGFSYHDNSGNLPEIVSAYDWDVVQLQINYYDWYVHDVKQSYEYLFQLGIPVVAMEPVGGGRLVKIPPDAEKKLKKLNPDASIASWAIRFCASLPGVDIVLSGMRTKEDLYDNMSCFTPFKPLSKNEFIVLDETVKKLLDTGAIPCSACRYCIDDCPVGIDIAQIFQHYNDYKMFNHSLSLTWAYIDMTPPARQADKCINCRKCSALCPQKIDVPEELNMVHKQTLLLALNFSSTDELEKALNEGRGKTVVLFGAGLIGKTLRAYLEKQGLSVRYYCDNGQHLWGTRVSGVEVISPKKLKQVHEVGNAWILITNLKANDAIRKQLMEMEITVVN